MATFSPLLNMASRSNLKREKSTSTFDSPSFCLKIATRKDVEDGKELPEPAVRKFGECMADSIYLKVPNCATSWAVELKKTVRGSRLWLQKGWEEFANFYNVDEGYFLVFSYNGQHSQFQARIFHSNSMEINYPMFKEGANPRMSTPNLKGRSLSSASSAGENDVWGAKSFTPINPQFSVTITSSYLVQALPISQRFAFQHFSTVGGSCNLTLQTSGEKIWNVKCVDCWRSYSNRSQARINLAGWRVFVQDNNLEVGDHCVFELIGGNKLKVHIARIGI